MKTKKLFNLIKREINENRLREDERVFMRSSVEKFLSKDLEVEHFNIISSPYFENFVFQVMNRVNTRSMTAFALVFAVLSGGSLSFAAEKSLPGEKLYAIKINVNEKVRDLVAVTPKLQANWEKEKIVRRLDEAKELQTQGKLDEGTQIKLGTQVSESAKTFSEEVKKLSEEGKKEEAKNLNNQFTVLVSQEQDNFKDSKLGEKLQTVKQEAENFDNSESRNLATSTESEMINKKERKIKSYNSSHDPETNLVPIISHKDEERNNSRKLEKEMSDEKIVTGTTSTSTQIMKTEDEHNVTSSTSNSTNIVNGGSVSVDGVERSEDKKLNNSSSTVSTSTEQIKTEHKDEDINKAVSSSTSTKSVYETKKVEYNKENKTEDNH